MPAILSKVINLIDMAKDGNKKPKSIVLSKDDYEILDSQMPNGWKYRTPKETRKHLLVRGVAVVKG